MSNTFTYDAPPTLVDFFTSSQFASFQMGPVGSTKSTACIMKLFVNSCTQPPDADGVRRTQHAIIRNTRQQLEQTCLEPAKDLLKDLVVFKRSAMTLQIKGLKLPDGTTVESKWLGIPLEKEDDQRRLLSLNLHSAWCSEFRELRPDLVTAVMSRLGRYPSPAIAKAEGFQMLCETNPFSQGSDWHKLLVLDLPTNWAFFTQPSGMSKEADWLQYLPGEREYYERLLGGHSKEWVNVHVHGKFGEDLTGSAVFRHSFSADTHVDEEILVNPQLPLYIGQDFGRTPACLITQNKLEGGINVLEELTAEDMGIELFAKTVVRPKLLEERYHGLKVCVVCDPAGEFKQQVGEKSMADCLRDLGFKVVGASTNKIEPRLRSVETMLNENLGGRPSLSIDGSRCPLLVRALGHEYKYKKLKTGRTEDLPTKDHPWSDLCDSLQYICLMHNSPMITRALAPPRLAPQRQITAGGWT